MIVNINPGGNKVDNIYIDNAKLFKALSDANRLYILDMLSCGELCACKILEKLSITQPTLSHHMKILSEAGFVTVRQDSKWSYYSLNLDAIESFKAFFNNITALKQNCVCYY